MSSITLMIVLGIITGLLAGLCIIVFFIYTKLYDMHLTLKQCAIDCGILKQ